MGRIDGDNGTARQREPCGNRICTFAGDLYEHFHILNLVEIPFYSVI